jgi:hypothetical protein
MIKVLIKILILRKRNAIIQKLKKKKRYIINELEKTEKDYVDKLYAINKV